MNLLQLKRSIGKAFRLRPFPSRVVGPNSTLVSSDDPWRLDEILDSPSRLRLINTNTGSVLELGADNVREFRTPDFLLLRCRLSVREGSIEIEPFVGSDEQLLGPGSTTDAASPVQLDDIIDLVAGLPYLDRGRAFEPYYGLLVTFRGPIWSITRVGGDRVRVQASTPRNDTDVWFEADLREHPQLAIADEDYSLTVAGFLDRLPLGFGLREPVISQLVSKKGAV
jgi:hypothetical protein